MNQQALSEMVRAASGSQADMEKTIRAAVENRDTENEDFNEALQPVFISCSWERKELVLQFHAAKWMQNPYHIIHGGILTSCMDLTMGLLAVYLKRSDHCMTVQMNTEYMRPMYSEGTFTVRAEADKIGRHMCFMRAELYRDADHQLAAKASGEFM